MAEKKILLPDLEKEQIPTLTPKQKRKKIILLVAGLIGFNIFVFGTLYLSVFKSSQNPLAKIASKGSGIMPTPSPFPFQEMTIPALRARDYYSKLNEIQNYSQSANYNTYLTSYDSDGYKINGLLTVPNGKMPEGGWPAIVFVHGYIPPSLYATTEKYGDYVEYLARNGYVVFKIDLRGHGNSEGEPGGGYYGSDYIVDTLNARAALQKGFSLKGEGESLEPVKIGKIGLWGHSMAGNVVTRAMAARPDIPAVAIWGGAVYTYSDMQEFGISDNSYRPPADANRNRSRRELLNKTYGQFDPKDPFWKQVPFTNYLDDIKGAISLNHAQDDDVVNIGYSISLNSILNKTKIPHEFNEYVSGGHNISGPLFVTAMQNTVAFYDKYLK